MHGFKVISVTFLLFPKINLLSFIILGLKYFFHPLYFSSDFFSYFLSLSLFLKYMVYFIFHVLRDSSDTCNPQYMNM